MWPTNPYTQIQMEINRGIQDSKLAPLIDFLLPYKQGASPTLKSVAESAALAIIV